MNIPSDIHEVNFVLLNIKALKLYGKLRLL